MIVESAAPFSASCGDSAVPQIVGPEARQARLLRQRPPSRSPAIEGLRRIERGHVVVDHLLAAESELGNKGRKDVMRRFDRTEALGPHPQPCQHRRGNVRQ